MTKSLNPFSMTLSITMIISSIMAMSSNNWMMIWLALEINMLSFIPLMNSSNMFQETEAMIKYFLIQAMGSSILLMTSTSMWNSKNPIILILLSMSLILKLGMFPCHKWFPSVMTSISWTNCLILSTWQKLAPMSILVFTMYINKILYLIIPINAIIGAMMGMNQTKLKSIMAFSSITHMSWMSSFMLINKPILSLTYLLLYSLIIIPMFIMFHKNMSNTSPMNIKSSPHSMLILSSMLLTIGGLPPLMGFFPKWITLWFINSLTTMTLILILSSIMNLFFYLNLMFSSMLSLKFSYWSNKHPNSLILFSLLSMPMLTLLMYAMTLLNKS